MAPIMSIGQVFDAKRHASDVSEASATQAVLAELREAMVVSAGSQVLTLLPLECRVLAVGEGDFVFSESLLASRQTAVGAVEDTAFCAQRRDAQRHGALVATCLPTEAELCATYAKASSRLEGMRRGGAEVICGVDATCLDKGPLAGSRPFDRIVFNFPLLPVTAHGSMRSADVHLANRAMLASFLRTASRLLSKDGLVFIASKDCFPYSWWRIESLPQWSGGELVFMGMLPWGCTEYPSIYSGPCNVNRDAAVKPTDAVVYVFARPSSGQLVDAFVPSEWHRTGGRHRNTGDCPTTSHLRCDLCRIGALSSEKDLAAHQNGKIHTKRAELEQRWEEHLASNGSPVLGPNWVFTKSVKGTAVAASTASALNRKHMELCTCCMAGLSKFQTRS